jgi:23S rRNA (uracil1939-C5)-methyltransferase
MIVRIGFICQSRIILQGYSYSFYPLQLYCLLVAKSFFDNPTNYHKMAAIKEGCVERCPGCSHRLLSMPESLAQKEGWLKKQLTEWKDMFVPICSEEESDRWGYRRKILLTARCENSRWNFGMIRRDEFIAIPECPVHAETSQRLIRLLISVLPPDNAFPLAFLYQSDALVTLVLKTKQKPSADWLTEDVIHELKSMGVQGISMHLNPSAGRRMFAKHGWHLLWGKDYAYNRSGLIYGRTSFSQLIHRLHALSLDETEIFLNPGPEDCVADLYCGIGSSLVRWINRGAYTIRNAPGAMVLRGTCRQRLPQLQEWIEDSYKTGRQKLLYANPPRTGIESEVLEWIAGKMLPGKLAYLSCSAGTLRRDLEIIASAGYAIKKIIPFDFFPQTHHVECLVLADRM